MPTEITMPQLSDTMSEGTVVKWLKREGDKVATGEKVAEVETDKAVMEMESFEGGTLAFIVAKEGDKVAVGQPIAVLASSKENPTEVKQKYTVGAKAGTVGSTASGGVASASLVSSSPVSASPVSTSPASASNTTAVGSSSTLSDGPVATLESASSSEVHERADMGHHATRETPHAVPPLPHHGENGNGNRLIVSPLA
jgi:pyruvate dehydrogenase E2 component (dihydrolipoamide acetyltransferase)